MKKKRKKKYWQYLLKHLCIWFLIGLLLLYVLFQGIYFFLFQKIQQKTATNFYEGMEQIQVALKDQSLLDAEAEVTTVLAQIGNAGTYVVHSENIEFGGPIHGWILPIRLGRSVNELLHMVSGELAMQGEDTTLGGIGKGWAFIQDEASEDIVISSEKKVTYLYLQDRSYEGQYPIHGGVMTQWYGRKVFLCEPEDLKEVNETLEEIRLKWKKTLRETDPDFDNKNVVWELDDFYVKGDRFFPAKYSLYYGKPTNLRSPKHDGSEMLLEEITFEPKSLDGYSLYGYDREKERAIQAFININSDVLSASDSYVEYWKPDAAFQEEALKELSDAHLGTGHYGSTEFDMGSSWSEGSPFFYFLNGKMIFVRCAYVMDGAGHAYKVCAYQTISDLFLGNYRFVIGLSIWVLFFAILLAFCTSYAEYGHSRYLLMTEDYRRTLMDSMAHDLKSPLMAISGYAENLSEHLYDDKREHYVQEIQKSVTYMNELVMKNLEILKFDGKVKPLRRRRVDMKALFEESLSRYQGEIERKKLKVSVEGDMIARGNEDLLQRVAENLVTNSIRYTPEGGEVELQFTNHRLIIQNVTDVEYQGKLSNLWEPFVRGEDSRTGRGTGLGLSIVANVLSRHKWNYRLAYDKEKKVFSCIIKIPYGILF